MIDVAGSITLGTILVGVLVIWRKASAATEEYPGIAGFLNPDNEGCPQEFVSRIFSSDDSDFIRGTQSESLKEFFLRERKGVALLWVRETSIRLRQILREHTTAARQSENLNFQTELGIFLRYVELRGLCVFLFVGIALAGPMWVRKLALRANVLCLGFNTIRESLQAGAEPQRIRTGDSL
jgi:hypothetical protein